MQIAQPPKDASSPCCIEHLGLLSVPPPPSSFMKVAAQHPPENKCPFVLWPHASPAFNPRPACPTSWAQLARRMQAAPLCHCGGCHADRPPWWLSIVQGPRRGQNLFAPPPYKDCQPLGYRKQNKTNKSRTAPDHASQVLTFYQPVLTFIISQADPLRQERWQISIVSLASLPFSGLCSPMKNKTKQNETLASPQFFPTPNPQVVSFTLFWILVLFSVFCFVFFVCLFVCLVEAFFFL